MTRPAPMDVEIDKLHELIRAHSLPKMITALKRNARRDRRGGSAEPDGFPAKAPGSTLSNGGSNSDVTLTAVESAADAAFPVETQPPDRLYVDSWGSKGKPGVYLPRKARDELHGHVMGALEALEAIDRQYLTLVNHLAKAEALASGTSDPPGCESCKRIPNSNGKPTWTPVAPRYFDTKDPHAAPRKTDVGGRLKSKIWLCDWCGTRVGLSAEEGSGQGALPTEAQLRDHLAGKIDRQRVDPPIKQAS